MILRLIGVVASACLVFVVIEAAAAIREASWFAVPDLASLELTVMAALAVAATVVVAPGRRAFRLDAWPAVSGWRARLARLGLVWVMSLVAVLGVLPGFALGLGPPAVWPVLVIALSVLAARVLGAESPRRVAWLLCTSYGLAATSSLVLVRHVF